jgi:hypothetical protein
MDTIMASITGIICELCAHALSAVRESYQMPKDPLNAVFSYVEKAYIRLQVGDVLIRCLEEESAAPIQQLVEGLVLAGPQSLDVLREILAEVDHRKMQIMDDLHQVNTELEKNFKSYGLQIANLEEVIANLQIAPKRLLLFLREQGIIEEDAQAACVQLLHDSQNLMESLEKHLHLMDEIETFLRDWLWGLAYQSAHQESEQASPPS